MIKHWQYTMIVPADVYSKFSTYKIPIDASYLKEDVPFNTAVYINSESGGKRLEGVYDSKVKGVRPLQGGSAPNRDLRLYLDALASEDVTMIAVDGLMGTGKTSTCVEHIINQYLKDVKVKLNDYENDDTKMEPQEMRILIAKPHVNSGGSHEQYGFLPGDIDQKLDPTLNNFIQYFNRWHQSGFDALRKAGYIEILPLGFIRGLDATNMVIIADETQNTKELISVATRKAENSKVIFLGDTSPFQIDLPSNTPKDNGLTHLMSLLQGAPYFQYIEMKTLEHIVRSDEVKDIVKRLFKKYGTDPQEWEVIR